MTRKADTDDLPRPPLRRRVLVLLLAVATALTILLSLIYRPGDPKRGLPRAVAASEPAAAASTAVGGKAEVLLLPAPAAASR